ncbi:hypothetical protein EJB05_45613, partial [Eragrostis curvula]
MIHHLRARALSFLFQTPSHLPSSRISPHRLFSTAAPASPKLFAVEDYLVASCGLTRAQALKASRNLSDLKSTSKPDAVLAFLSGLGIPLSDIATLVASDPRFLSYRPRRRRQLLLSVFNGSFETLLRALRLFVLKPKSLREAAERVEELGINRGSRMFRRALAVLALMSREDVSMKMGLLQKIGFSQDDALIIVRKAPLLLRLSDEKIRRAMHFLTKDVGLEAPYIAQRPALLGYSLERRLLPRHRLLKVLKEKGLLNVELDYYATASIAEKIFIQKFVLPYKDHVPGLADEYASRCSGSL